MGFLFGSQTSPQIAMEKLFDGNILLVSSKRYIQNFLVVTRARPEDDGEGHSDDTISDDGLFLDSQNFEAATATRMGSAKARPDTRVFTHGSDSDADVGGNPRLKAQDTDGVDKLVLDAFHKAERYWKRPQTGHSQGTCEGVEMDKATLDIIKKAAADSPKKEHEIAMTTAPSKAAALSSSSGYSTADVQNWFTE